MHHREPAEPEDAAPVGKRAATVGNAASAASIEYLSNRDSGHRELSAMGSQTLSKAVLDWLNEQGYPTEYKVATVCSNHGFRTFQGYHVSGSDQDTLREIDVLSIRDTPTTEYLIRVCHVIECKWSKDKPCVVLTSPHGQLGSTACVAKRLETVPAQVSLEDSGRSSPA